MDKKRQVFVRPWQILLLIACVAVGGQIGMWLLDNDYPYDYDAAQSYVRPNPADDGTRVTAYWKFKEIRRSCPATSQRYLRDASTRDLDAKGNRIPYSGDIVATYDPTPAASTVKMSDDRLVRTFVLPRGLPPEVDYSSKICFSCNPAQWISPLCMMTPELTFSVVQGTGPMVETPGKTPE